MIYFIRHAATEGNLKNVWVGRNDQPVTPTAYAELERVANHLSQVRFTKIYASPLQRAVSTATEIKRWQKHKVDMLIEPALIERDFAEFEGCIKSDENRHLLDASKTVESIDEMKKRLMPFIRPLLAREENILLVSHSAVFKCLKAMDLSSRYSKNSLNNLEWDVFNCCM